MANDNNAITLVPGQTQVSWTYKNQMYSGTVSSVEGNSFTALMPDGNEQAGISIGSIFTATNLAVANSSLQEPVAH